MLELGRRRDAVETLRTLLGKAPQQYGKALKILVSSGHGQFWLRPSAAAAMLQTGSAISPNPAKLR
jgi:hypothetical protein